MHRILIVEDELSIRRLISIALSRDDFKVDYAEDGHEGYNKIKKYNYDVVLLDIMLPRIDGINLCKRIRKDGCESYVIMLTAIDDEENKLKGFESGADDYITKPFSPNLLLARINAGLRRVSNDMKKIIFSDLEIDTELLTVSNKHNSYHLTVKEFELLTYLVRKKGRFITRNQLLIDLWGFSYDGDTRIIDVHISKLRHYLKNSDAIIVTKRGIGYMITENNND